MTPYWTNGRAVLWQGHVLDCLAAMEAGSVHCTVTSPPYWSLRSYPGASVEWPAVSYAPMAGLPPLDIPGCDPECVHVWGEHLVQDKRGLQVDTSSTLVGPQRADSRNQSNGQYCQLCSGWRGCLGLEPTPEMFVGHIVLVARELWRVLRDDGTFWLNFGDSMSKGGGNRSNGSQGATSQVGHTSPEPCPDQRVGSNLPAKNVLGIPWRVAFALQADGWYLRSDIIWAKGISFCPTYSGSCMPGSQQDRPTTSHEHVFLLSKKARYFYDNEAIREPPAAYSRKGGTAPYTANGSVTHGIGSDSLHQMAAAGRTVRTVWTIGTGGGYKADHFATFPPALVEPMIKAGTSQRGCCPSCGSPWVRVTEKSGAIKNADYETEQRSAMQQGGKASTTLNGTPAQVITTGWRPTCSHYDWEHCAVCGEEMDDYDKEHGDRLDCGHNICAECLMAGEAGDHVRECELAPVPCTVLDPFAGTFTTGEVAIRLGRAAVGIELSQAYCDEHIKTRLSKGIQMELL